MHSLRDSVSLWRRAAVLLWDISRLDLIAVFGSIAGLSSVTLSHSSVQGNVSPVPSALYSLRNVKGLLPDTSDYIRDSEAARQLGKALFGYTGWK